MDAEREPPFVSVIVPVYNGEAILGECLTALRDQTYPRDRYEIVLVDDGSTDSTVSVARDLADQVLSIEQSGPGAARNRGVERARGELLLFTDADCVPCAGWIESLAAAFDDPAVVGAKGTYRSDQREWTAKFVQVEYESRYDLMRGRDSIDFIDTYSAAYRRDVYEAVGGFDESFRLPSVEDQELSFRISGRGGKLVFVPDALVGHLHIASPSGYFRKKMKIAFWKMKVLARYPGKAVRDSHTPLCLKLEILAAAGGWASLSVLPIAPIAAWSLLFFLALHGLSSAPFVARILPKNRALAWRAPLFLGIRSTALLIGMVRGSFGEPLRARTSERRMEPDKEALV